MTVEMWILLLPKNVIGHFRKKWSENLEQSLSFYTFVQSNDRAKKQIIHSSYNISHIMNHKHQKKGSSLLCLFLLVGAATGCFSSADNGAKDKRITYTRFPEEDTLTAEAFTPDEANYMRYPFRIQKCGSHFYIHDLHGERHFMHIYEVGTMKHVTSFARRGEGPEETLRVSEFHITSPDSIWLLDDSKRQLTRWSFTPGDTVVQRMEEIDIEEAVGTPMDFCWQNDTSLFIPDYQGKCRIMTVNKAGHIVSTQGDIPSENGIKDEYRGAVAQAWRCFIDYHPEKQLLVAATQLGDVLELYDLKAGHRTVLAGPGEEPEYKLVPQGYAIPIGLMGYSDVQVTDHYIYAVYHGRTFKEIASSLSTEDGGRYLRVFRLDGTLVRCYHLDHAIYGIHVDEQQGIVWATDVNVEEQVLKYTLK